jgi:osmoprotectant transport system permease protein
VTWLAATKEPLVRWDWVSGHLDYIRGLLLEHMKLTAIAVVVGLAISLPLAVFAYRHRWAYAPLTWITGVLYTIPSLALFILLIPFTGLSATTAEIALVSYTLLILIRNTVTGLAGVPEDTKEAALGMGYTRRQLLWKVEIPLAIPAIVAGVRIAAVTTVGLVTVASLIGVGGLGALILRGLREFFPTVTAVGAGLCLALALTIDGAILLLQKLASPWARASRLRNRPAQALPVDMGAR